jgi:hypothetical protein
MMLLMERIYEGIQYFTTGDGCVVSEVGIDKSGTIF